MDGADEVADFSVHESEDETLQQGPLANSMKDFEGRQTSGLHSVRRHGFDCRQKGSSDGGHQTESGVVVVAVGGESNARDDGQK